MMKPQDIYALWLACGCMSLIFGMYLIGGTGVACITFGVCFMAAGIIGLRNNAKNAG